MNMFHVCSTWEKMRNYTFRVFVILGTIVLLGVLTYLFFTEKLSFVNALATLVGTWAFGISAYWVVDSLLADVIYNWDYDLQRKRRKESENKNSIDSCECKCRFDPLNNCRCPDDCLHYDNAVDRANEGLQP